MAKDWDDIISGRSRSSTKRMVEALLARASAPNPSLGGALGHGLAMGIMGMIDAADEKKELESGVKAQDAGITALRESLRSPMGNTPPTTPSPSTSQVSPQTMSPEPVETDKPQLSGGFLPAGGIDRSALADALGKPGPMQDKFVQTIAGETGFQDPTNAQINAESAMNRWLKRGGGDPVSFAQKDMLPAPQGGYYDSRTAPGGAKLMGTPEAENFRRNILPAVLSGSDVGTEKLGFTPDGNASGQFAVDREKRGIYGQSGWLSGTPGKGEMYVNQFKGDLPRQASLGQMLTPSAGAGGFQPPEKVAPMGGFVPQVLDDNVRNVQTKPTQIAQAAPPAPQAGQRVGQSVMRDYVDRLQTAYDRASPREKLQMGPALKEAYGKLLTQEMEPPAITWQDGPDGGKVPYMQDPKRGTVRQLPIQGQPQEQRGITLADGQTIYPPPGADYKKWRQDVTAFLTEQQTGGKPLPADIAGRVAMYRGAKGAFKANRDVLLGEMGSKEHMQYGAYQAGLTPVAGRIGEAYNAIDSMVQSGTYAATGAQAPDPEVKKLVSIYIPKPWDPPELRQQKVKNLEAFLDEFEKLAMQGRQMPMEEFLGRLKQAAGQKSDGGGEMPTISSPADAMKLPSGTKFIDSNGRVRIRP